MNLPNRWKEDCDIVRKSVSNDIHTLGRVSTKFKSDKLFALDLIENLNWYAVYYLDQSLKDDKQIMMAAVKKNGYAYTYASDRLKSDKE